MDKALHDKVVRLLEDITLTPADAFGNFTVTVKSAGATASVNLNHHVPEAYIFGIWGRRAKVLLKELNQQGE